MEKAKKIFSALTTVLLVLLIALVVFLFVVRLSGNTPSVFGFSVYRVSSGSMEPTLKMGDVILVKKTAPENIHKNDIITYKARTGEMEGQMITHRVVEEPEVSDGSYCFQTKGDKEGASLDPIVYEDQVQGRYLKTMKFIDKLYAFFFTKYGLIIFIFLIVALFGYELISLLLSYRRLDEKDDDYYEPKPKKPSKKRKKK